MTMQRRLRGAFKARGERQQVELACRIVENVHFNNVYDRAIKELGDRAALLGPLDMTRNLGRVYVDRLNKTRTRPPFVSGMPGAVAKAFGDYSAATLIRTYRDAGGAPLPTTVVAQHKVAQDYQLFCGYAGVALNYSSRTDGLYVEYIRPADVIPYYGDDDPYNPTIIDHYRRRVIGSDLVEVVDRYDLTDLSAPKLMVLKAPPSGRPDPTAAGADLTGEVFTAEDIERFWAHYRDADGKPFHKIVVTGHPSRIWDTNPLIEGTLKASVLYTHHGAGIRDSCYSAENIMDLEPVAMTSDEEGRTVGTMAGPEVIRQWRSRDPEKPGQHWQSSPAYDPEVVGRAIRDWEMTLLSSLGLPVSHERTGGDPTEHERRALNEAIARNYAECRMLDGTIVQRACMLLNRISELDPESEPLNLSEAPYGVLYREEIDEALAPVEVEAAPVQKPTESTEEEESNE